MHDIFKKLVVGTITFGGLEYVKYRVKGGKPLLEKAKAFRLKMNDISAKLAGKRPIELEAGDYKVV